MNAEQKPGNSWSDSPTHQRVRELVREHERVVAELEGIVGAEPGTLTIGRGPGRRSPIAWRPRGAAVTAPVSLDDAVGQAFAIVDGTGHFFSERFGESLADLLSGNGAVVAVSADGDVRLAWQPGGGAPIPSVGAGPPQAVKRAAGGAPVARPPGAFEQRARELAAGIAAGEGLAEELEGLVEAEGGSLGVSVGPTGAVVLGWRARAFGQAERDTQGGGFVVVGDIFDAGDEAAVNALLDTGRPALVAVSPAGVRFVWRPGVRVEPEGSEAVQP